MGRSAIHQAPQPGFAKELLTNLADKDLQNIALGMEKVQKAGRCKQSVRFGSMCTGSGMGHESGQAFFGRARKLVSLPPITHPFACESNGPIAKRRIRLGMADLVFKDICQMGQDTALEWSSEDFVQIPECDVLDLGFSCRDLSGMNTLVNEMTAYVIRTLTQFIKDPDAELPDLEGTTIPTLLGALRYVLARRPAIVCMENVSNVMVIIDLLKAFFGGINYSFMWTGELDPTLFRIPMKRPRVYMVAYRKNAFDSVGEEAQWATFKDLVARLRRQYQQMPMQEITAFLLPSGHQYFEDALASLPNPGAGGMWEEKHNSMYTSEGMQRPNDRQLQEFARAFPFPCFSDSFLARPQREKEVAYFYSVMALKGAFGSGEIAVDLSQCISRQSPKLNMLGCFTRSSLSWLAVSRRFMTGRERLAIQGMSRPEHSADCNDTMLGQLAGNAYHGNAIMFSKPPFSQLLEC